MLNHLLRIIGYLSDQPRCYYALTEAYCELVGRQGTKMEFKAIFVDGPWAGQSVNTETKIPRFEVTRSGKPADGVADSVFIYEPGESRMEFGVVTQDFKITYDGPLYGAKISRK